MIYTELTKKAMNIAYKAHEGQFDKCGFPYICHPIHLAESIITTSPFYQNLIIPNNDDINEYLTCVALLHDVVEDSDTTLEDLSKEFPFIVTQAVDLLTHRPGVDYLDYIYNIKSNVLARYIKILDILHNKNKDREALIDEDQDKKYARNEKYRIALRILTDNSYKEENFMKSYKKPKWSYQIEIIKHLIEVLYSIPGGYTSGGCCHIVVDDDNIDDDDLKWVINYCETDGKNKPDAKLSKIICEYLLELDYEQRVLLFALMNDNSIDDDLDEQTWNNFPDDYCGWIVSKFKE